LKNNIKIIITDLDMPHVNGLEFIEALQALYSQPVIIVVSGKGLDQLEAALAAEGASNGAIVLTLKEDRPQR